MYICNTCIIAIHQIVIQECQNEKQLGIRNLNRMLM